MSPAPGSRSEQRSTQTRCPDPEGCTLVSFAHRRPTPDEPPGGPDPALGGGRDAVGACWGMGGAGGAEELKVNVVLLLAWGLLAGAPGVTGALGAAPVGDLGSEGPSFLPGTASTRSSIIFCAKIEREGSHLLGAGKLCASVPLSRHEHCSCLSTTKVTLSAIDYYSHAQTCAGRVSNAPSGPALRRRCPCAGWLHPSPPPTPARGKEQRN